MLLEEVFKLVEDKGFVLISGCLALIMGLVTVILHNVWVTERRVLITILGWRFLIKGIVKIGFPEIFPKLALVTRNKLILAVFDLVIAIIFLGAWLIWMSY